MSGVLVVIPTYNEVADIGPMLDAVTAALPLADVLVVDDGSPDGTAERVEAVAAAHEPGRISVLRRARKAGLGTAYVAGFRRGIEQGYDVLVQMDADFQHDPASLPSLLTAIEQGADMAIGSRYVTGGSVPSTWPWHRKRLSRLGNRYARTLLELPANDVTAGFRASRRTLLERMGLDTMRADGYGFQIELTYRARLAQARIVEVPIHFGERTRGESKMSLRIVVEALLLVTRWSVRRR